jgi:YggT family protein
MLISVLANIVNTIASLFIFIIIIDTVVSFFLNPYHPVRRTLDGIVNPLLTPIRRVLPPLGGFDFSPLVLIILIEVLSSLLQRII